MNGIVIAAIVIVVLIIAAVLIWFIRMRHVRPTRDKQLSGRPEAFTRTSEKEDQDDWGFR